MEIEPRTFVEESFSASGSANQAQDRRDEGIAVVEE